MRNDFQDRRKKYIRAFNDLQRDSNEKKREVCELSFLKGVYYEKKILNKVPSQTYGIEPLNKGTDFDVTLELGVEAIKNEMFDNHSPLVSQGLTQKADIDSHLVKLDLNKETHQIVQNDIPKLHQIHNDCTKPHQILQDVSKESHQIITDIDNPHLLIQKDFPRPADRDFAKPVHENTLLKISEPTKMYISQSQEMYLTPKAEANIMELSSLQVTSAEPLPQITTKNHLTDAYKTFSFAKSKPAPIVKQIDPINKITNTQNDKTYMEYDYIINWYQTYQKQYIYPVNDSPSSQDKRFRVEMKRIINMTVNAMSAHSASHLIDKWEKLKLLLAGQSVKLMGKDYNPSACSFGPQVASHYIKDCVASAIVGQGIKQVESNPKAAFFIAPIAVALASQFPDLQLVFMAHFYSNTALLVPLFGKNRDGIQPNLAQDREGQDVELNEVERLRTLKGTLQLYLAFLLTQVPAPLKKAINNQEAGLVWFGNAGRLWTLTARCINAIPQPDQLMGAEQESIEAVERLSSCLDVLVDVLALGTSTLVNVYGPTQTGKLLASVWQIARAFANLLDKGTAFPATLVAHLPSHTNMVISKLNIFLESCFASRNRSKLTLSHDIPEPPGLLPPEFWGFG